MMRFEDFCYGSIEDAAAGAIRMFGDERNANRQPIRLVWNSVELTVDASSDLNSVVTAYYRAKRIELYEHCSVNPIT